MRSIYIFVAVALLFFGAAARDYIDHWVATTEIPDLNVAMSPEVRDRNGVLLRAYTIENGRWRLAVNLADVDPVFVQTLITYEDKRFYTHSGVDATAMLRALWQAVWNGRVVSGGSTITMQVARLLENSGTGQWDGKLRQIRLALALERQLSKLEILQLYLELAPYGGNLEGIRAASLSYLAKEPKRLTLAEASLLVALPQSPETRRPDLFSEAAERARNRVLDRLIAAGHIDASTFQATLAESVPMLRAAFPKHAAHLADRARRADPAALVQSLTIDAKTQVSLEKLAHSVTRDLPDHASMAILVADHRTGDIVASVGSLDYAHEQGRLGFIDMTQAVRSPGSTLKPLVYAMVFDQGLAHPNTMIVDGPVNFDGYKPVNFDGQFRGDISVAHALRQSLNTTVVQLTNEIGPARLVQAMKLSGMSPKLRGKPGLAVSLGGVGVTLQDLVQLYAVLAGMGDAPQLTWRNTDTDQTVGSGLAPRAVWMVNDILKSIAPPAGRPADVLAYKTGTSYGHRDAWAIGFDGQHVAGVWIGRPDGTPVPGIFGGDIAATILFDVFQRVKPNFTPLPAPPADTLIASNTALPDPLKRFTPRLAVFETQNAPVIDFPPNQSRLVLIDNELPVKIQNGHPPFVILVNGLPRIARSPNRQIMLPIDASGYSKITVIDQNAQSHSITVWIE